MADNRFSPKVKEVISYSREEALRMGHDYIGTEHLLLALLQDRDSLAVKVLESLEVNTNMLRQALEESIQTNNAKIQLSYSVGNLPLTRKAEKVLKVTFLEAKMMKNDLVGTEHIVLSILKDKDNLAAKVLMEFDVDYDVYKTELEYVMSDSNPNLRSELPGDEEGFEDEEKGSQQRRGQGAGKSKSHTPVLDNFGRDVTKQAEDGKLDPIIGREKEIERVSQILSRRKKNNPILIGEPGVGKTAVVEGLALRIQQRKVSRTLFQQKNCNVGPCSSCCRHQISRSV
jgi:ATP-dependent Clp protease ATP-binding subunit ClpC